MSAAADAKSRRNAPNAVSCVARLSSLENREAALPSRALVWVETARNLGLERAAIAPVSETERAGWQGAIRGLRRSSSGSTLGVPEVAQAYSHNMVEGHLTDQLAGVRARVEGLDRPHATALGGGVEKTWGYRLGCAVGAAPAAASKPAARAPAAAPAAAAQAKPRQERPKGKTPSSVRLAIEEVGSSVLLSIRDA